MGGIFFGVRYGWEEEKTKFSFRGEHAAMLWEMEFSAPGDNKWTYRGFDGEVGVCHHGDRATLDAALEVVSQYTGVNLDALGSVLDMIMPLGDGHACAMQAYQEHLESEREARVCDDEEDEVLPLLIDAAIDGDIARVQERLDAGDDINETDLEGWTALMYASDEGHSAVVDLLRAAWAREDGIEGDKATHRPEGESPPAFLPN